MSTRIVVTRTVNKYRRSMNGAWMGNGCEISTYEASEDSLKPRDGIPYGIGDGSIHVKWPDGVTETAYPSRLGSTGYPPECFPSDGRLAKLLRGD